jgi:hypothetical protein
MMPYANYLLKIENALQNILTKFLAQEILHTVKP